MTYKTYEVRVYDNGTKEWYHNGLLHRDDGPAIENAGGDKFWYQRDELHRIGGPAIEYSNGTKRWYQNGKPHREDGPAIDHSDGSKFWYLNGVQYSEKEFLKKTNPPKEYTVAELETLLGCSIKIIKE